MQRSGCAPGARTCAARWAVLVALAAVAIVFNLDQNIQTRLGGYSSALQKHIEDTSVAKKRLHALGLPPTSIPATGLGPRMTSGNESSCFPAGRF